MLDGIPYILITRDLIWCPIRFVSLVYIAGGGQEEFYPEINKVFSVT